jgi:hypothetical protein
VGLLGTAVPKLASGLALGAAQWVQQLTVQTVDTGTLGVGKGTGIFAVPSPALISALLAAYAVNNHRGSMSPLEATGIGNGLSTGFAQGLLTTAHPSVGVGGGAAKIVCPPAFPSLMQGFSSVGITGQVASLKASAISSALLIVIQALVLPVVIAGSASQFASGGSGFGKII